jgi:hypothetical protein
MPKQQQDFAFQSTDQPFAHPFGGAEGAPAPQHQHVFAPQPHQRYETQPATNASIAPPTPTQGSALDLPLTFSGSGEPQDPAPHPGAPAHVPADYGFGPGGPLVWDWGDAIDFTDCTPHYEPQGELVQELQAQRAPNTDFSIPLPVAPTDTPYQSPPQPSSVQPAVVQNPLSPPPRPTRRLSVQTSMKRKANSEPNAEAANGPVEENPAKRQSKSRASSITSMASPVVTSAAAPESHARPSLSASIAAPPALENTAQLNTEAQKRKDPSKGTGPQGRVIDVSTPRRVVESRGGADILPSGKVFPIQIGSELFRLSGASLSSDGEHHVNYR